MSIPGSFKQFWKASYVPRLTYSNPTKVSWWFHAEKCTNRDTIIFQKGLAKIIFLRPPPPHPHLVYDFVPLCTIACCNETRSGESASSPLHTRGHAHPISSFCVAARASEWACRISREIKLKAFSCLGLIHILLATTTFHPPLLRIRRTCARTHKHTECAKRNTSSSTKRNSGEKGKQLFLGWRME